MAYTKIRDLREDAGTNGKGAQLFTAGIQQLRAWAA